MAQLILLGCAGLCFVACVLGFPKENDYRAIALGLLFLTIAFAVSSGGK